MGLAYRTKNNNKTKTTKLACEQGRSQWQQEQEKLNNYYHQAMFDIYHIHNVYEKMQW